MKIVQSMKIFLILRLAENIDDIQIFVGEFAELNFKINERFIIYKEHPTTTNYKGIEDARDWLTSTEGYFPSFFKFWNKGKKELKRDFRN